MVTENAYGMAKGRWRFLYKRTECRLSNIKYVIHAIIALHNICIDFHEPYKPRWVLKVRRLSVRNKVVGQEQNKNLSELTRLKSQIGYGDKHFNVIFPKFLAAKAALCFGLLVS